MEIKEFNIPVPWGEIAVKAWGKETDTPILTFHGIQDNAGSFDLLIPLLPRNFYYLCFDLPGHGRSSHFPGVMPIHLIDYVIVYKMIVDYLGGKKYIFMGHSFGGQLSLKFAQLYPEHVTSLIMLDAIHSVVVPVPLYKDSTLLKFYDCLRYIKAQEKNQQPTYTYDEALNKIIVNRAYEDFTEEAATVLLKRNIVEYGDGIYKFSIDPRLKFYMSPIHDSRYAIDVFKAAPVRFPVLMVIAKKNKLQLKFLLPILKYIEGQKNFVRKYVDYHHDVHLTHPEIVAPLVTEFLLKSCISKL